MMAVLLLASACGGVEPLEAAREVVDEVVDILEPGMDAQGRAGLAPGLGGAQLLRVARDDQALEAAPGIAHAEELHAVEHGFDRRRGAGLEDEAEESRGAAEIAFPDLMAGMAGH